MRKLWQKEKYNHIPTFVKVAADAVMTEKYKAEERLETCKCLMDLAVARFDTILDCDNTPKMVEDELKKRMEQLLQAYLLYCQLQNYFEELLKPYADPDG